MKRVKSRSKQPISRSALNSQPSSIRFTSPDSLSSKNKSQYNFDDENFDEDDEEVEDEVMGEVKDPESRKSNIMERNLNQMIDVLHLRLGALEDAARIRLKFCEEDLLANSKKMSKQAPKMMEDFEEVNPRLLKDKLTGLSKDINLVSAEGVFIDPIRLIIKTRAQTETAKKLELKLEESFGIPNLRELKGKKSKASNRAARSKKSEARKFEAKKQQRQKLEKDLQTNMESYVTRSVLDADVEFRVPDHIEVLPITIKWSSKDIRSTMVENADGEMDPDLLLQYGIERISLPPGDAALRWVVKQAVVHSYFVHLFWFIKVKFFQRDNVQSSAEKYLLQILSLEYVKIVELFSKFLREEHEKDFVFRYLPYILSNSVFYGFFFLCPGSRHLYTKGFRKAILLQVVQVLYGIQLCPISVKVIWAKLFPEEAQDDDDVDEKDLFPTSGAVLSNTTKPVAGGPGDTIGMNYSPNATSADTLLRSKSSGMVGLLETDETDGPVKLRNSSPTSRKSTTQLSSTDLFGSPVINNALSRTVLKPPMPRPNRNALAPRQRKEISNANDMSPLMQEYLSASTACGGKSYVAIRRTVPVSWCVTGGSDTHHRKQIPKELHDELSNRCKQSKKLMRSQSIISQHLQIKTAREIDKACAKVLGGGSSTVGRFSLDLVKRRKNPRSSKDGDREGDSSTQVNFTVADPSLEDEDLDHLLF